MAKLIHWLVGKHRIAASAILLHLKGTAYDWYQDNEEYSKPEPYTVNRSTSWVLSDGRGNSSLPGAH